MNFTISLFSNRHDTQPKRKTPHWNSLVASLTKHVTREDKDGPLWSPCEWNAGRIREDRNLEKGNLLSVSCFVADIDDGTSWESLRDLWGDRAYILYSSHSSTTEKPRWRVVFPLEVPIPAEQWHDVWLRCSHWLCKNHNDRHAKDPGRMYYTPAAPPATIGQAFTHYQEGGWLDAGSLPPVPAEVARPVYTDYTTPSAGSGEGRPGDDYNAAMTQEDIAQLLERHGARRGQDRGDAIDMIRPGKPSDVRSGTIGHVAPGVFYCFSDNWPPLQPGRGYDAFTLYTVLEHGGDYRAAAAQLAKDGYGWPDITITVDTVKTVAEDATDATDATDGRPKAPPLTEMGNAERLILRHGQDLRWSFSLGWHVWDTCCWSPDESGEVVRRAKATVRKIADEAKRADEDKAKAIRAWAFKSESNARVQAMIHLAQSEPGVYGDPGLWDTNPMLLNCANGTLDLETGKLRDFDRADRITRHLPYAYDPKAVCPLWDAFIAKIMPEHIAVYLQRSVGYTLSGLTDEQCLWYLYGAGSNGKTTFVMLLQKLLGPYAIKSNSSLITVKPAGMQMVNDEIANLYGKRLAVVNEFGKHERMAENEVKKLTDTDFLRARLLYKNSFQFRQTHKIWIAANPKLRLADPDEGLIRRLKMVLLTYAFSESEKDIGFLARLEGELPGILNWALRGWTQYRAFGMMEPACIRQAAEEYAAENYAIGQFFEDCCVLGEGYRVQPDLLFAAYAAWAKRRNETNALSQTLFGQEMKSAQSKKRGINWKPSGGRNWYTGIGLQEGRMD